MACLGDGFLWDGVVKRTGHQCSLTAGHGGGRCRHNQRLHEREFREVFAKFSRSFHKFFKVFVGSETCWDLFRASQMRSDMAGCARERLEAFGCFRKFLKFFALVPNTGEANDEMCARTALIISQMYAFRLENNNRLCRQKRAKHVQKTWNFENVQNAKNNVFFFK